MATQTAQRSKPSFFIISIGYWQGQEWQIEEAAIEGRKNAEAKLEAYRTKDNDQNHGANGYDVKQGRKFRMISKTEAVKMFGQNWWESLREQD